MSDLTGLMDHSSETNGSQTNKASKRLNSKTKSLDEHFGANSEESSVLDDDGVSCLTENSKSTKGTARSKSKKKKKKKRSPSKKSNKISSIDENHDQHSTTNKSVGSRRSKSRRSKYDDEISISTNTSDRSKLDKRDRLYHSKSYTSSGSSVTSRNHCRDDDGMNKNSVRRTKSLPLNARTSKLSTRLNAKKKANTFGNNGNIKLKILADGSVRASVPKRSNLVDRDQILRASRIDKGSDSDSDSVSLSDSSDEDWAPSRRGVRAILERSMSLQQVREMALVSKRNNATPPSSAAAPSRSQPPIRLAARSNSFKVRSTSADYVREMQGHLVRTSSHKSLENSRTAGNPNSKNVRLYAAASARGTPLRRGVNRNSSEPLRSAMRRPSYSGTSLNQPRGPPPSTKSAYVHNTQRRPPVRRNSNDLSTAEHVEILRGLATRNFDNNSQRSRSSSQPPSNIEDIPRGSRRGRRSSKTASTCRSLPPNREALRNNSHRSYSRKESYDQNPLFNHLRKSDLDSGDLKNSMALNQDNEDHDSEHESLNDSRHVIGIDNGDFPISRNRRKQLCRESSGYSTHSMQSNRSQMSIDKQETFESDPKWKAALRYIYLFPPSKHESKLKKKTRIFTWIAMLLDFIAAIVAAAQYQGSTTCCGEPVFDIIMDINWDILFRVITYLYMCMIPAEIIPVIKNGIPFNIVNPAIGMIITFGMFFDDSIAEAVAMWVIEALAIFMEFMVYRVNARIYFESSFKLTQVDEELKTLRKKQKGFVEMLQGGSSHSSGHGDSRHGSRHKSGPRNGYSTDGSRSNSMEDLEMGRNSYDAEDEDEDSLSGNSFGCDEDFYDDLPSRIINSRQGSHQPEQIRRNSKLRRTKSRNVLGSSTHSNCASTTVTGITGMTGGNIRLPWEIKKNKLLRQRRILRMNKQKEKKELRYHFIGSVLNVSLATVAMIFIVTIASTVSTSSVSLYSKTIHFF